MKRTQILALVSAAAILAASMAGCGSTGTVKTITQETSTATSADAGDLSEEEKEAATLKEKAKEAAESSSSSEVTAASETSSSSGASSDDSGDSAAKADITIEPQVLIDEDGLKVTAQEYVSDDIWGDSVKLLIENNGSSDIGLGCDAIAVNDYMVTNFFSATVAAGKKSNETLDLSSQDLEAAGIKNIGQIEAYFHTFDPDTYMTQKDYPVSVIKTSAFDQMDIPVNDDGTGLYNANGIRIVGKTVDENSFWGAAVLLYIENNSGQNVTIQCDDLSINGFMLTPMFSCDIINGKKALDTIDLSSTELEENGIESIDEVELKFVIFNTESWSDIDRTDAITFQAK